MEASELRLNNWVTTTERGCECDYKVVSIDADFVDLYHLSKCDPFREVNGVMVFSLRGIPLTEERLKKFGFLRWDDEGFYFEAIPNVLKIFLYPIENSNSFAVHWDHNWITSIKFVHQLQNLFFCLTGEELKIKSK